MRIQQRVEHLVPTLMALGRTHVGGNMPSFEQPGESATAPSAAARMLEVAAVTADRLVADAEKEAESLLAAAQAEAEEIAEAGRNESARVLGRLADEKAELEAHIATLHQMEAEQRHQMRSHLTEHLALLDAATFEPPTDFTD